jgi:hypothetical protein
MPYSRPPVPRDTTDWTVTLNNLINALLELWPTAGTMTSPATLTPDHVAIVDTASGVGNVILAFSITTPPTFGTGVAPEVPAGGLSSTVTTTTGMSVKMAQAFFKLIFQNDASGFANVGSGLRNAVTPGNFYLALYVGAPDGGTPAGSDCTVREINYP